jgi:hypothetical protein
LKIGTLTGLHLSLKLHYGKLARHFQVVTIMATKQFYETAVSRSVSFSVLEDIRDNEQSVQAFTEMPAVAPDGGEAGTSLAAHDLFFLFTAGVIREQKIFTR